MRKLLLAVLMVVLIAMPAFASVQNVKVNGAIDNTWVVRDNFDLGLRDATPSPGAGTQFYQNMLITQVMLGVSANLTDNVDAVIQILNEASWESNSANAASLVVSQAYTKLGEFLYSPLTLYIGRQPLRYGNALIVGDPNTNNLATGTGIALIAADLSKQKAFDAVRAVLDYNPLTIDLVAAKISPSLLTGARSPNDDINLFGVNANYKLGDSRNTEADVYFFSRIDNTFKTAATTATGGIDADTVYTPGVLIRTNPIKGLNVSGEVAWQFGNKANTASAGAARGDNQKREAMAAQIITSYAVPFEKTKKWNPVVAGWGTYLSGDPNPTEATNHACLGCAHSREKWTGWDPLFEDQSGGTIYNTLFDYTDSLIAGGSLQVSPIEDVIAKLSLTGLWLSRDLLSGTSGLAGGTPASGGTFIMRQPDGTAINPVATTNRYIGSEIDADLVYNYTEDVQFGLSYGVFIPGQLFDVSNTSTAGGNFGNNQNASQWLLNADVAF